MSLPHVTDHCVLRYLERVAGFDVEATRRHIALLCAEAVKVGAKAVKAQGHQFKIKENSVVTVTPAGDHPNARRSVQRIKGRAA